MESSDTQIERIQGQAVPDSLPEHASGKRPVSGQELAPKYRIGTDEGERQIKRILQGFNAGSLPEFISMIRSDKVSLADAGTVYATVQDILQHFSDRKVREPNWNALEIRSTIKMDAEDVFDQTIESIHVLTDGRIITTAPEAITVWSGQKSVHRIELGLYYPQIGINPSGERLFFSKAVFNKNRAYYELDLQTFDEKPVLKTERPSRMSVSPRGMLVVTEKIDGSSFRISVCDPDDALHPSTRIVDVGTVYAEHTTVLSNGQLVCMKKISDKEVGIEFIDPFTGEIQNEIRRQCGFVSIAELSGDRIVMDGTYFHSQQGKNAVKKTVSLDVYDMKTGRIIKRFDTGSPLQSSLFTERMMRRFDVSPHGQIVWLANRQTIGIEHWNPDTDDCHFHGTVRLQTSDFCMTNDGKIIVACPWAKRILRIV